MHLLKIWPCRDLQAWDVDQLRRRPTRFSENMWVKITDLMIEITDRWNELTIEKLFLKSAEQVY